MSPEVKAEIPAEAVGEAAPHGHGRLIAVATVLTTLLAALTGFLQASALRDHDEADASAERLGTLAVNAASANQAQAQVQIDRFQQLQGAGRLRLQSAAEELPQLRDVNLQRLLCRLGRRVFPQRVD